ncbi:MAG: NADH:flavin oxidoreductase [Candidatus Heimdallarchaeota archaeon]|nr:MAG: NADH:flavin oxidoreductase [Candidatus Heimdallarchaeota archaeon]
MELHNLFSPHKIGNVPIKNRIVRSATAENMADEGHPNDQLIDLYTELAKGEVGLIITGGIAVDPSSTFSKKGTSLHSDGFISSHRKLVKSIHSYDTKIAAQIGHTGRQSSNRRYEAVAPSAILYPQTGRVPRALSTAEIREIIIPAFVEAGWRAYESGYDMVQLHAAHGYLLGSFLTPYTNQRTDEFGGSTFNRTKILIDIYHSLRDEVGKEFPIIIKLQTQDGDLQGGLKLDEGLEITKIVYETGFDAIEPSGGGGDLIGTDLLLPSVAINSSEEENYFLQTVKAIRTLTDDCPLILMGGIRNPLSAERFIQKGITDFISMSRPLICEPDLAKRWKSGDHSPALCESCNSCYYSIVNSTLECILN